MSSISIKEWTKEGLKNEGKRKSHHTLVEPSTGKSPLNNSTNSGTHDEIVEASKKYGKKSVETEEAELELLSGNGGSG